MDNYSQADMTVDYIRTICIDLEKQGIDSTPVLGAIEFAQNYRKGIDSLKGDNSAYRDGFKDSQLYLDMFPAYAREHALAILSTSNIEKVEEGELPF